jgi:hypothetical protein
MPERPEGKPAPLSATASEAAQRDVPASAKWFYINVLTPALCFTLISVLGSLSSLPSAGPLILFGVTQLTVMALNVAFAIKTFRGKIGLILLVLLGSTCLQLALSLAGCLWLISRNH